MESVELLCLRIRLRFALAASLELSESACITRRNLCNSMLSPAFDDDLVHFANHRCCSKVSCLITLRACIHRSSYERTATIPRQDL